MKKILTILLFAFILVGTITSVAKAVIINLEGWGLNTDGNVFSTAFRGNVPGDLPATYDTALFDFSTGLGLINVTVGGAGTHSVDAFFDHQILVDSSVSDGGNSNEEGAISAALPVSGQSWEIDEPGIIGDSDAPVDGDGGVPYFGDIFVNFEDSTLDNKTFFDDFDDQNIAQPTDVSMAMGWDFTLDPGYFATISFLLSDSVMPSSGFFLTQTDIDSNAAIYFSSTLSIEPVPEPATIALLGIGLAGLAGGAVRRKWKKQAVDKS